MNFELLNNLLETAILHGGDNGGPYFTEDKELELAIHKFMAQFNIEYHIEWEDNKRKDYPLICPGRKEGFNSSEFDMTFQSENNMDKFVIPLIEYFNANGLPTHMSCQGHNSTNMSRFWISFTDEVGVKDIERFQCKHLNSFGYFCSCGRFAKRYVVCKNELINRWEYYAATIDAAMTDLSKWKSDDITSLAQTIPTETSG